VELLLERFRFGRTLTIATLVALAAGVVAGTLLPASPEGASGWAVAGLEAVGAAWMRALRMTVVPLVVGLLIVAILATPERAGLARLGGTAVGIFLAAYLAIAVVTALLFPPLIRALGIPRGVMETLPVEAGPDTVPDGDLDVAAWLLQALPANPFAAAVEENLLQLVVFTILFAVAAGGLAPPARASIVALFSAVTDAMLVLVAWLLRVSPVAIFALSLGAAHEIGIRAAWILVAFAVISILIMLLLVVALVPIAGVLGRVGTMRFARAAWPGQVVGLTTRSSLAALPALVEGARSRLCLPDRVVGFGLPLAASMFKPSVLVSAPGRLLFLGWVLALPVSPLEYAVFVAYALLMASTTLGVPSQGGRIPMLPAYLALGIPIEGVLLLESVDVLWDFAATVLNATGYLAATTLLPRGSSALGGPVPAA
jgi:Na+/H+-dicarboxylate symporter